MSRRRAQAVPKGRAAGVVRIIGGRWRGTRLEVLPVEGLRPTPDRVRETLFNWLAPVLPGARVLDLFAGSGALGLEAVSRGAREAHLVERDPVAHETLRGVVDRLGCGDAVHVHRADAIAFLGAPIHGRFDVVFLDPPFEAGAWQPAIERLGPWLERDAWLYLESPPGNVPSTPGWRLHREGATRDTRHALYRRDAGGAGPADTLAPAPESPSDAAQ
ncbi:16S rRNA (guanine(966)-N(2))-methyltransferase RsmD [Luteimonas pelagia]